jgi:hypothetical protein
MIGDAPSIMMLLKYVNTMEVLEKSTPLFDTSTNIAPV